MSIFSGLDEIVEADYVLARHTWYGMGGPADYFIRPKSTQQLSEAVTRCKENGIKLFVIGFGSNLLISDQGVRGAVIKLESDFFSETEFENDLVTAWAGADLKTLVLTSVKKGLSGIEMLTGIPGSVGGAVRMNTGGNFGDIGSVVESVSLMDAKGQVFEKSKPELSFDYRSSNITAKLVLNAKIRLTPGDPERIMRTLQETWIYKKNRQPLNSRNCGCVFKNPRGQSAGVLIDRAGLKGLQVGGARVSDKHANFIVAQQDCKSVDVLRLIDAVRERVQEQSGVVLESEIEVWE